jgi:hypothetical protein
VQVAEEVVLVVAAVREEQHLEEILILQVTMAAKL